MPTSCWRAAFMRLRGYLAATGEAIGGGAGPQSAGHSGACLGLALASVQILPLAAYLAKSPVWSERQREARGLVEDRTAAAARHGVHGGSLRLRQPAARPAQPGQGAGREQLERVGGGLCGSGHADLAGAAGRRSRAGDRFTWRFWPVWRLFGAMGAFRLPPVDNLLRALPVLDVTDNRRLTLWVSFALMLLGGIGLDQLAESRRLARSWIVAWVSGASCSAIAAGAIGSFEGRLRERALAHYRDAAAATAGADRQAYQQRAERQVGQALSFLPRYYGLIAVELAAAGRARLSTAAQPRRACAWIRPAVLGLVLVDLAGLGFGLNPAIARRVAIVRTARDRPAATGDARRGPCARHRRGTAARTCSCDSVCPTSAITTRSSWREACDGLRRSTSRGARNHEPKRDHLGARGWRIATSYVSQGCVRSWRPRRRPRELSRGSSRWEGSGSPGSTGCPGPQPSRREAGSRSIARRRLGSNSNRFRAGHEPGRARDVRPGMDRAPGRQDRRITAKIQRFSANRCSLRSA